MGQLACLFFAHCLSSFAIRQLSMQSYLVLVDETHAQCQICAISCVLISIMSVHLALTSEVHALPATLASLFSRYPVASRCEVCCKLSGIVSPALLLLAGVFSDCHKPFLWTRHSGLAGSPCCAVAANCISILNFAVSQDGNLAQNAWHALPINGSGIADSTAHPTASSGAVSLRCTQLASSEAEAYNCSQSISRDANKSMACVAAEPSIEARHVQHCLWTGRNKPDARVPVAANMHAMCCS